MIEAFRDGSSFRHSQNLLLGIHSHVMPEILNQASMFLSISGPLIEPFRGDEKGTIETLRGDIPFFVIPKIFYWESKGFY